jgi:hypothetical protein
MARMAKFLSLCLVAILVISCILIAESGDAQTIPQPSVPEFTAKYVDYSYYVPPTYGIDQYTGENVTITEGYNVDNRTIVFTIKNQAFTPYTDSNSNNIGLYYNFRAKGYYGTEWNLYPFSNEPSSLYPSTNAQSVCRYDYDSYYSPILPASKSEYTEIIIPLRFLNLQSANVGNEVDFAVQVMIGHIDLITTGPIAGDGYYSFTGKFSTWSNTQTITLSNDDTINPSPTVPEFPITITLTWIIIGILVISVISLLLYVRNLKRRMPKN